MDCLAWTLLIALSRRSSKGSTCAFTEQILRSYGFRTGFYSSPHLVQVRERIRINGKPIGKELFTKYFWQVYGRLYETKDTYGGSMPAYFRFLTILAFHVFLQEKVDLAVIEVGIGGAYDCTNIIRSFKVGTLNRITQALVIAYVIGYVCVLNKGYQETDAVLSSVTTKVKGIALTNTSDLGLQIWDVADYVIPPQEESSFFVLTNLLITLNQTQSHCPEVPKTGFDCTSDRDCKVGSHDTRGNGVQTGKCVSTTVDKTCEVLAWCPLELDKEPPNPPMLADAENFTVLIKNSIRYPKFNFNKRNILPYVNKTYLEQCVFNRITDPDCPIFRLKDMVTEANEDFQTMAVHGGVMGVQIRWECDLDMPSSWCVPRYTFRRLDNKDPVNNVAPGYNFRFAKYYKNGNNEETRTLIKGFGIRFDVMVFGQAGKFNIVPTLLNVGAGLALLGLVTVVCDWIVLTCMTKRNIYNEQKYSYVDDFQLLSNETP